VRTVERKPSTALRVYGSPPLARALDAIERFVLRHADLVIPMAGFTRDVAIRAGVAEDRILDLPIPPRWGTTEVPERSADGSTRIAVAARLERPKAVEVLVHAFASVAEDIGDVSLEVAGDGRERPKLEELVSRLGLDHRVRFHGWVPAQDMPRFFSEARVDVLPSRVEEGHGMALREAALAGCAPDRDRPRWDSGHHLSRSDRAPGASRGREGVG
jgi:glycosyltransferase involved in cell wall biosynthesis